MKTYTLVELDENGQVKHEVFRAPDDMTAVARAQLACGANQVIVFCGDRLVGDRFEAANDEMISGPGTIH